MVRCPECGTETSAAAISEWERKRHAWRPVDTALVLCGIIPGVMTATAFVTDTSSGVGFGAYAGIAWLAAIPLSMLLAWIGSDRLGASRRITHAVVAPIVVLILNVGVSVILIAIALTVHSLRAGP